MEQETNNAIGSWFYEDYKVSIKHACESKNDMLANTVTIWSQRNLTRIGNITVIKTNYISKMN